MRPLKKRTAPPQKGSITATLGESKFYLKPSFELALNFVRSKFREVRYQLIESAIFLYDFGICSLRVFLVTIITNHCIGSYY